MSVIQRRGGKHGQLANDSLMNRVNFGFEIINKRVTHALVIIGVGLNVTGSVVHVKNVFNSLPKHSPTVTQYSLLRALVHFSRLDYCNGVRAGIYQYQYDHLQSVLRTVASLVLLLQNEPVFQRRNKLYWLAPGLS